MNETDNEDKPKDVAGDVKLWHERVSLATRELDDWARQSGAERYVHEYNGKFEIFFNGLKGKIAVPPINDIFSYVQSDLANTYNRDPYISVNPKSGTVKAAKLWEIILNYFWRKLKLKDEIEPEIIDKDLIGFAWHKVGFEVESEGPEEDLRIVKENLYSGRVGWRDVVYNLGSKNPPYDCLWMAQRIVKPLSFVRKKYKNAKDLKGVENPDVDKNVYQNAMYKDDIKVAILWEIWDREEKRIFLIADGLNDKYLSEPRSWTRYLDEFPFLQYWDFHAPGQKKPMSSIAPWEAQVLEKMVIMAAAVNHAKRWSRQALIRKGAISSGDLDKFERGDDGAIIDYTGTGELEKSFKMVDWGNIPVDYYQLMDRLAAIQRDANGQPEFERGGVTKTSTRTEGELQLIRAGAQGRQARKIDRLETHIENIARHMLMHLKGNFDFEETIKITGITPQGVLDAVRDHIDPVTNTIRFRPEDIEGEHDIEIKSGSTLPLNNENKRTVLNVILQELGPVLQSGQPLPPVLNAIVSEMIGEFEIKSIQEAYEQQQMMAQQVSQTEEMDKNIDKAKIVAETHKRAAQADQIDLETAMLEAQMKIPMRTQVDLAQAAGLPAGGNGF